MRPKDDDDFDLPGWEDDCFQKHGIPGLVAREGSCGSLESPEAEYLHCWKKLPFDKAVPRTPHVLNCLSANEAANMARRAAGERFGNKGDVGPYTPPPGAPAGGYAAYGPPDGSRGNAFQHMVWNGLMVKFVGFNEAKGFADRHEMNTLSTDPEIREWHLYHRGMDFANNHYGRELAVRILKTNPGKNFKQRLYDEAERFVRDNQACWIENYAVDDKRSERPRYFDGSRCGLQ